jgi:hypothetical protein
MKLIAESSVACSSYREAQIEGKHPCKRISASLGGEADGGSRTRNPAVRSSAEKRERRGVGGLCYPYGYKGEERSTKLPLDKEMIRQLANGGRVQGHEDR